MTATTFTHEEFFRRMTNNNLMGMRTPQEVAISKLEDVARMANELGRQGHGIKRVEIIVHNDCSNFDNKIEIRILPLFKLKEAQP